MSLLWNELYTVSLRNIVPRRFVKRDAEVRSWNNFIGNLWILADSYSYRTPYSFGIYLDFYFQGMCGLCYLCCLVILWHEEEDYRVDVLYLFQVVVTR